LVERGRKGGLDSLSEEEVEDLARLYRAAATHLSLLQAFGASVRQRDRMNRLVNGAHAIIYGRPAEGRNWLGLLVSVMAFPRTVRRTGRYHLLALLLLALGAAYGYFGSARDPDWVLELVPAGDVRTPYATRGELRESLLAGRPESAHAQGGGEKAAFAAFLWQNNTKVALTSFFSGFLFGIPTSLLVLTNGAVLGVYTFTFHSHGLAYEWWAWILPHGVTELLALVLLAGGGLLIGHRVLAPGRVTRSDALRAIRSDVLSLVLFAFPMLLLAALIESFVRQSGLSDPARYWFALGTAVFWVFYLGLVGRGDPTQPDAGHSAAERVVPLSIDEELYGQRTG
jgi:uncharacterized membrane protein SpoIIM required for sporulation